MPRLTLPATALALLTLAGCSDRPSEATPAVGDADHGAALIQRHACGACHEIPGIPAARGQVGPPLGGIASRVFIAGVLTNTPQNMSRWVRRAQDVLPGNAMPNTEMSEDDSRDVAAYLYTLR